jgi:GMP synthase (glutamine-hydrolysing)
MYEGKPPVFDAFISHDDEIVSVTDGTEILCGNDFTSVQAVSVEHGKGTFWGVQYHPEYDLREIARLMYCRKEKLTELNFFQEVSDCVAMVEDLEKLHDDCGRRDIAWKYGLDADVLDRNIRQIEVTNWIQKQVLLLR